MNIRTMLLGAALLTSLALPVKAQERATQPSTKQLIEQLGDPEFNARQEAEKQLKELGKTARVQLEKAAKDHEDPEVRWRAQRVLRSLERDAKDRADRKADRRGGLRRRQPGDRRGLERIEDVDRLFDEIFQRLERDLDIDIKDIRRHMERARAEARAHVRDQDQRSERQSKAMRMSVTPDGVRVEIEVEDKDGKTDKKVYEAEDMESFKKKYPEVARRFGIGGPGIRIFRSWPGADFDMGFDFDFPRDFNTRIRAHLKEHQRHQQELMKRLRVWQPRVFGDPRVGRLFREDQEADLPPKGERLGVRVGDVSADVAEFLGLDQGDGLQVGEVLEGSLAQTLGIRTGDIILKIGDRKIRSVDDVRTALRQIKAGDTVAVQVNRRGKTVDLGARKPAVEEPKPAKLKRRGKVR